MNKIRKMSYDKKFILCIEQTNDKASKFFLRSSNTTGFSLMDY